MVRRVGDQLAVVIGRTIAPPNWPALTQGHFRLVNLLPGSQKLIRIIGCLCQFHCTSSIHQCVDQLLPALNGERGITASP
ncbi:Uncharacterized protein PPKH_2115 [Pseudomonas putida]|nr:Uncharacterized protein PPKH_2115 [Pseudomonas putida]